MKYLTQKLKDKNLGSFSVSYVIELDEGHNKTKNEDGTFKGEDAKLIFATIIPQNDLITIDFDNCSCNLTRITINSEELRSFADELLEWADIMDETNL